MERLAGAFVDGPTSSEDYFEKAIDATVAHDRMLLGLYSLFGGAVVFLLFQAEMSPWAGAALVTSGALFAVGLGHTSIHLAAYHKMLLLADAVKHGDETVELETGEEEATPEDIIRAEAAARHLHSVDSQYLFLGLVCAGVAAIIDHWQYAWRAFAVLAGVAILFLLAGLVSRIIKAVTHHPDRSTENEPRR